MAEVLTTLYGQEVLEVLQTPPSLTTIRFNTLQLTQEEALNSLCTTLAPYPVYPHPQMPDVLCIDVQGPNYVEPVAEFVIVDPLCGEAVLRGANVFAPGVLAGNVKCKVYAVREGQVVAVYAVAAKPLRGSKLQALPSDALFLGNGRALMVSVYSDSPRSVSKQPRPSD